jgi:hypothetical protein
MGVVYKAGTQSSAAGLDDKDEAFRLLEKGMQSIPLPCLG